MQTSPQNPQKATSGTKIGRGKRFVVIFQISLSFLDWAFLPLVPQWFFAAYLCTEMAEFVLKSGLRILIRAPEMPKLLKRPVLTIS